MRIDELILTGFGRFQGRRLPLSPGLNLIYGPNEAGKSTIGKFIYGMLYGFKKQSQRRAYTPDAARFQPWQGGEYRGALLYTLASGRQYRVERRFEPHRDEVRLYDASTGADLTGQYPVDRRKELLFAEAQWGLSAEAFRSTAWVGQLEVGQLEAGQALLSRVANLQETGREDLSVQTALRFLGDRAQAIGTERAATKPYGRVLKAMAAKRQELERSLEVREQVRGWEAALAAIQAEMVALDDQLAEWHRQLDWARLREAEAQRDRVLAAGERARAAREVAAGLAEYAGFPAGQREAIRRQVALAEQAERQAAEYGAQVEALTARLERLSAELEAYPGMAAYGPDAAWRLDQGEQEERLAAERLAEVAAEADRLAASVAGLEQELAPLREAASGAEERLSRLEALGAEAEGLRAEMDGADLEPLRAAVTAAREGQWAAAGQVIRWAAVGLLLLAGAAGLAVLGRYMLSLGLLVGGIVGLVMLAGALRRRSQAAEESAAAQRHLTAAMEQTATVRERLQTLEVEKRRLLAEAGVVTAADLRRQVLRYNQMAAERERQQARREQFEAALAERRAGAERRRAQLAEAIRLAMGAEATPEAFQTAYAEWQQRQRAWELLEGQRQTAAARQAAEAERAQVARREAEEALAQSGVTSPVEFEAACARQESWQRASAEAETLEGALRSLLGDETAESLAAEVERRRGQVRGEEPVPLPSSAELEAQVRTQEAHRTHLQAQAGELTARLETLLADLPDTATLRQELTALEEERLAYEEELAALDLAQQTITSVASEIHREFAPKLHQAMGEIVGRITGDRYRQVRIDEAMAIRAIAADDRTVELLSLSGGTVDQFYLSLRLALLDLVTEGQEPVPLLLDDPFVQYDDARAAAAIAFLAEASRERQVILMTCHRREVDLAAAGHLIDLRGEVGEAT